MKHKNKAIIVAIAIAILLCAYILLHRSQNNEPDNQTTISKSKGSYIATVPSDDVLLLKDQKAPSVSFHNKHSPTDKDIVSQQLLQNSYDIIINSEDRDFDWTNRTKNRVSDFLSGSDFSETTLSSVDCRDSVCRVEFTHFSEDEFRRFTNHNNIGKIPLDKGDQVGITKPSLDEGVTTLIYFSKVDDHRAQNRADEILDNLDL